MAENVTQSPQLAALRNLLQADTDVQAWRQQAHAQAEQLLADSADEAARLLAAARTAAEAEAKTLGEHEHGQAQAEAEQARQLAQQRVDAMNQRAQERLADATAFLAAWVKDEA